MLYSAPTPLAASEPFKFHIFVLKSVEGLGDAVNSRVVAGGEIFNDLVPELPLRTAHFPAPGGLLASTLTWSAGHLDSRLHARPAAA